MEASQSPTFSRRVTAVAVLSAALLVPASAQVTLRVSVDSSGAQANSYSFSSVVSISAEGRYVAFESMASNLVVGDTNGLTDIFVRDRLNGTTERVSVDDNGVQANEHSGWPWITPDGRYVAFHTDATNLVPGNTDNWDDIFVRDRQLGTIELISIDSSGGPGNGQSIGASMSPDGRYVVYWSVATDLVAGDTNADPDVFLRDRLSGTTELISVDSSGVQGNNGGYGGHISSDGRYVAFASNATNLVAGDTNAEPDVFLRDRLSGTTERVNLDSSGGQTNFESGPIELSMSADGRYVAFESHASNLVPADTNGDLDVFVRDRQLGTTERVSIHSSGAQGDLTSINPSISADGRYVAFTSYATNLVPGDTNGEADIFVHDRQSGTTERVSIGSHGSQGTDLSDSPSISADGRYVAFISSAPDLVIGDTNVHTDVFVRDRLGGPSFTSLCEPAVAGVIACPCANPPSGLGRGCNNAANTGGAILSATGATFLSSDSLVFTTSGEKPTALSILLQGTSVVGAGVVYGQGVRCVGGTLKRLFSKNASGGSVTFPNFAAGDPTVSARSAAKGNPISAGQSRWYLVFYRDPIVLGGCPSGSTFNATQTGHVTWSP